MKVSTKGRYGLRAMVDLAIHSSDGHVALNAIAERQDISVNYLEQVFSTLRKAGLVRSVKGAQGGYMMAMRPSQMTVGMILRALEGKLVVVDETENTGADRSVQHCIQMMVWDVMTETVNSMVDQMTLENLVNEYRNLSGKETSVYYI
jgi:Rrf2 family transcriptional regulator, cysteine metabolism repressor